MLKVAANQQEGRFNRAVNSNYEKKAFHVFPPCGIEVALSAGKIFFPYTIVLTVCLCVCEHLTR